MTTHRRWGKVYLPDGSYREMTEWALPVERQLEYDNLVHEMQRTSAGRASQQFVRGGFWRNFKVKYPEANEMYSRMMMVSRRLAEVEQHAVDGDRTWTGPARELYRGQCNCGYWHGAFGGIYLPHLRNAVYNHLIAADNLLDQATGRPDPWIEATVSDFNFDARQEVRLANDKLICLLAPAAAGSSTNWTCGHLPQPAGHARPAARSLSSQGARAAGTNGQDVASIHDRVVFKQEGLDQRLQYDEHLRKSLLDHFYSLDTNLQAVRDGQAEQLGDFLGSPYETRIRRNPDRIQVLLTREGYASGIPLKLTKGVTPTPAAHTLEIAYLLEGLPTDRPLHFGVEFNFAGLPSHADDRYFYQGNDARLGPLHSQLDLAETLELGLVDQWLGIDVRLIADQPTSCGPSRSRRSANRRAASNWCTSRWSCIRTGWSGATPTAAGA